MSDEIANAGARDAPLARRWGPWATLGWSVIIAAVFLFAQILVFVGNPNAANYDGDVLALATLLTTFLCAPLVVGIAKLKRGSRLSDYLPVTRPTLAVLGFWLLVLVLFSVASDLTSWLTGRPIVPDFMTQAYTTADSKLLLWAGIALGAPLFEELFFRGFLYAGLAPSRLGARGAIVLVALLWALIHIQYDWYGIATIFVIGVLLGVARARTGSLVVPLLLHVAGNSFALLETAFLLGHGLTG